MTSVAIIGSGIAGLGCAYFLHRDFAVTVFEADAHIGGHANTVAVEEGGRTVPIDTGFMVFNHVTYPQLTRLFRGLAVPTKPTDMSFSVHHGPRQLEYRGTSLNHLFAQRTNLFRPSFYRMLRQIDRFNRDAVEALNEGGVDGQTLAEFVAHRQYGEDFLHLYLVPMSSAVWSTPPEQMLQFPAATLLRFFHNHGFLGLHTQHPWYTIEGGSREYVRRLIAPFRERVHVSTPVRQVRRTPQGVEIVTDTDTARFDRVIFACHPPTTLRLLGAGANSLERALLSTFKYQQNTAQLHTDSAVMPARRLAWSAWNYRLQQLPGRADADVLHASTHYWMNRLQGVSDRRDYFVSLNARELIRPAMVLKTIAYEHPLFDLAARNAQSQLEALNAFGKLGTWSFFAGAWQGYGFHEDGLASAAALAEQLLARDPYRVAAAIELS